MFYKPNYCCNCGEKIERVNWSFTTSRQFCEVCQTNFVLKERLPQIFVVLMAFVGIFGVGSYWRSGQKPLTVSTRQMVETLPNSSKNPANRPLQVNTNSSVQQSPETNDLQTNRQISAQTKALISTTPRNQLGNSPIGAEEAVYFCGASTKKGTPCSRRVKGSGRCWQHKGQNAMLPPEKLMAGR